MFTNGNSIVLKKKPKPQWLCARSDEHVNTMWEANRDSLEFITNVSDEGLKQFILIVLSKK